MTYEAPRDLCRLAAMTPMAVVPLRNVHDPSARMHLSRIWLRIPVAAGEICHRCVVNAYFPALT